VLIDSVAGVERLVAGSNGIASPAERAGRDGGARRQARAAAPSPRLSRSPEAAARGGLSVRGVEAFEGILGNA
jgi:hypothetical protein